MSPFSPFTSFSRSFSDPNNRGSGRYFSLPTDPKKVLRCIHRTAPSKLPDFSASVHDVRFFLFTILTMESLKIAKVWPQWVLETCAAWEGDGAQLRAMEDWQLHDICPLNSGYWKGHSKKKIDISPAPACRAQIGVAITVEVMRLKSLEQSKQNVAQAWHHMQGSQASLQQPPRSACSEASWDNSSTRYSAYNNADHPRRRRPTLSAPPHYVDDCSHPPVANRRSMVLKSPLEPTMEEQYYQHMPSDRSPTDVPQRLSQISSSGQGSNISTRTVSTAPTSPLDSIASSSRSDYKTYRALSSAGSVTGYEQSRTPNPEAFQQSVAMHPRPYDPFFSIHACSPDNPYDAGYIAYGSMPLLHTLQSPCYSFPYSRQTPNPQVVHHAPAHQQQNTPFHKSPECHELPASPLTSPNLRKAMSQMTLVTDQSMRGNYAASMHSARADYPESPIAKSYPRPPVWYNDYTAAFHVNSKERNPLNLSMSDLSRAPCNAPTNPPNSTVPNRRQSTISRQPAPTRALSTIIPNTKPQPSQSLLSRPSTRHIPPRPYQPDLTPINKPLSGPNHSTKTSNVDRYALEQGPHINFRPTPSTTRTKFAGAEVQRMHNMVPSRLAGEGVEVLGPRMRFFDPNGMPYSTLVERIREKEVLDGRAQRRSGTAGGPDSGFLKNDGRYFKGM